MQSSKIKMDEFKSKFMDLLHKQTNRQVKIPAMGFSDYFVHTVTASEPLKDISRSSGMCNKLDAEHKSNARDDIGDDEDIACNENDMALVSSQKSDQEILESVDKIYFRNDNNTDLYELKKVLANGVDYELINTTIAQLRKQHKVISKQVLQNILEQRNACIVELAAINETQKELEEALWICRKGRSYLNDAKTNLTTTSLQILASYRKREIYKELLSTLRAINKLKSTDVEVQKLLSECNYSGAIALLLNCKDFASEFMQYNCVQSLDKKLQETLLLTEFQLDMVLNEMILNFDLTKYIKLQQAYKLLNKSLIAMDQIHINYISAIHSSVNSVVRSYIISNNNNNDAATTTTTTTTTTTKYLYEQLCEQVEADKYVTCLIHLCNTIWTILSSYYQIIVWHQNHKLYPQDVNDIVHNDDSMENDTTDAYIQEKLGKGQSRIWNDILTKICIYLQSTKLITLKYEHFIQVLAIAQRLKKVGQEFCGENSEKLIETMRMKSELFFDSYHIACLEEVCLFLENESWTYVESFTNILQLSEFRSVRYALRRHKSPPIVSMHTSASINNSPISIINNNTNNNRHNNNNNNNNKNNNNNNNGNNNNNNNTNSNNCDELVSIHSQDGISSIYGSCGYFIRFSEKSSPFDGGLDVAMLEEDILSGVVDEASCYFSEESDDEQKSLQSKMGDFDESLCTISNTNSNSNVMVNSTTLNIFRCMGRYLQMCKLLHCVSPKIIASMLKLMDFYVYAVYEVFAKDTPVQLENFYSQKLEEKLDFVRQHIVPHIKIWPLNFSSLTNNELSNPDTLYGLPQRIVAVQSGHCMLQQFYLLHNYLNHLLPPQEHSMLSTYFDYTNYMTDLARPVYTCVTLRVFDINSILAIMAKVKWNIKHVTSLNNTYIDIMCRNVQHFAMRLEEISKEITISLEQLWNCMAHVATHLLVEGFSQVKECTPGGRALMQLDFINFMSILELISKQKFPNHRAYVDTFIKVYYFSNEQLEDWIMEQISASSTTITPTTSSSLTSASSSPYSTKQLMNLVSVGGREKKTRQKLLNLLTGESNLNTSTNAIT